jgi:hypothetical protein
MKFYPSFSRGINRIKLDMYKIGRQVVLWWEWEYSMFWFDCINTTDFLGYPIFFLF